MANAEADVRDLEQRRCAALEANNGEMLAALFAEDYVHCHGDAKIQGKQEMVAHTLASPRVIEPRTPKIRIYGDTAIITGEMVNRSARGRMRLFATQVAHRIDGEWKFVSFQSTPMRD